MYFGSVKGLVYVDIAKASDEVLVEEQGLDPLLAF